MSNIRRIGDSYDGGLRNSRRLIRNRTLAFSAGTLAVLGGVAMMWRSDEKPTPVQLSKIENRPENVTPQAPILQDEVRAPIHELRQLVENPSSPTLNSRTSRQREKIWLETALRRHPMFEPIPTRQEDFANDCHVNWLPDDVFPALGSIVGNRDRVLEASEINLAMENAQAHEILARLFGRAIDATRLKEILQAWESGKPIDLYEYQPQDYEEALRIYYRFWWIGSPQRTLFETQSSSVSLNLAETAIATVKNQLASAAAGLVPTLDEAISQLNSESLSNPPLFSLAPRYVPDHFFEVESLWNFAAETYPKVADSINEAYLVERTSKEIIFYLGMNPSPQEFVAIQSMIERAGQAAFPRLGLPFNDIRHHGFLRLAWSFNEFIHRRSLRQWQSVAAESHPMARDVEFLLRDFIIDLSNSGRVRFAFQADQNRMSLSYYGLQQQYILGEPKVLADRTVIFTDAKVIGPASMAFCSASQIEIIRYDARPTQDGAILLRQVDRNFNAGGIEVGEPEEMEKVCIPRWAIDEEGRPYFIWGSS